MYCFKAWNIHPISDFRTTAISSEAGDFVTFFQQVVGGLQTYRLQVKQCITKNKNTQNLHHCHFKKKKMYQCSKQKILINLTAVVKQIILSPLLSPMILIQTW